MDVIDESNDTYNSDYAKEDQQSSPRTPQQSRYKNKSELNEYETPKDINVLKNLPKILTRSQKNALPIFTPKWRVLDGSDSIKTESRVGEPIELIYDDDDDDSEEETDDNSYAVRHYSKEIAERFSWETRLKTSSVYSKESLKMPAEEFLKSDLFQTYKLKTNGKRLLESQWADRRNTAQDREDDFKRRLSLLKPTPSPPPKPKIIQKPTQRMKSPPQVDIFERIYTWKIVRNYGKHPNGRTIVMRKVRMTSLNPELFLVKQ